MKNLDGNADGLFLVYTTTSATPVLVKTTARNYYREMNVSLSSLGVVSLNRNQMVINGDLSNRRKGIRVTSESDISVLALNLLQGSYGEYLAYPCHNLQLDNYTYIAVSTSSRVSRASSQVLLIGCGNNTSVTVKPIQSIVLPGNITVSPGESHTLVLHEQQTMLLQGGQTDLSGTVFVSDKPLTIVSGHECGNVPSNVQYCEHLSVQVPPTATWGTEFLLAPFAGRTVRQIYRVTFSERDTIVQHTCNLTTRNLPGLSTRIILDDSSKYCSLYSNKPIFVTQWGIGGEHDGIGDPVVAPVPPTAQYVNKVSFYVYVRTLFFYNYISVTVPVQHFSEQSILLDQRPIRCTWSQIYANVSNGVGTVVGYGCNLAIRSGQHVMQHANATGLFSVMVYGYHLFRLQAYAYTAGMKLEVLTPTGTIIYLCCNNLL